MQVKNSSRLGFIGGKDAWATWPFQRYNCSFVVIRNRVGQWVFTIHLTLQNGSLWFSLTTINFFPTERLTLWKVQECAIYRLISRNVVYSGLELLDRCLLKRRFTIFSYNSCKSQGTTLRGRTFLNWKLRAAKGTTDGKAENCNKSSCIFHYFQK